MAGRLKTLWVKTFNRLLGQAGAGYHERMGSQFRQKNGQRAEVTTTRSGLQWEVLRANDGPKPSASSRVLVHYRGTLVNGVEFDSSYARQEPISFGLSEVITGWKEGLQLMSEGSQYRFVIPPGLAYGEQGAGPLIGPRATLIFEVELIKMMTNR